MVTMVVLGNLTLQNGKRKTRVKVGDTVKGVLVVLAVVAVFLVLGWFLMQAGTALQRFGGPRSGD
jgi:hypothetical protein